MIWFWLFDILLVALDGFKIVTIPFQFKLAQLIISMIILLYSIKKQ